VLCGLERLCPGRLAARKTAEVAFELCPGRDRTVADQLCLFLGLLQHLTAELALAKQLERDSQAVGELCLVGRCAGSERYRLC
jgi:hypothetical protein